MQRWNAKSNGSISSGCILQLTSIFIWRENKDK